MKKIISLFQRNYESDRLIRNDVVPGAEWVLNGEGVATRKWDGTCCLVTDTPNDGNVLWKRYDAKHGKAIPQGFVPAQDPDPKTGHWPGWVKCNRNSSSDKWHFEAYDSEPCPYSGTYELVGPKIQGNPEGFDRHTLVPHGKEILEDVPRDFKGLKNYLSDNDIEGIVWHHPDGRMVKIKGKDFGIKRKKGK